MAFAADGKTLVTVSNPSDLTLWDFEKLTQRKTINRKGGIYGTPALSPDGKTVALGARFIRKKDEVRELAGRVDLWDLTTGLHLKQHGRPPGAVTRIALSPDGRYALWGTATGGANNGFRLWDLDTD